MKTTIDVYDSQESFERARHSEKFTKWFIQMEMSEIPKVGDVIELVITEDHYANNDWYRSIPLYPYTVAEVRHESGDNILLVYYSGPDDYDFEAMHSQKWLSHS